MDNFVNRLSFLLEQYEHTASSFADKIGVQRSSLSHLLSGRNKPSLDFILKITEAFPEINLYWLLKGEGSFLDRSIVNKPLPQEPEKKSNDTKKAVTDTVTASSIPSRPNLETPDPTFPISSPLPPNSLHQSNVAQIVIFYTDGTFKNYHPKP